MEESVPLASFFTVLPKPGDLYNPNLIGNMIRDSKNPYEMSEGLTVGNRGSLRRRLAGFCWTRNLEGTPEETSQQILKFVVLQRWVHSDKLR